MNSHTTPPYCLHPARMLRPWLAVAVLAVVLGGLLPASHAIPYYARKHGLSCIDCHIVTPKLNERGESFLARGYRLGDGAAEPDGFVLPVSAWVTARHEERSVNDLSRTFVPKVELISGGPIAHLPLSYFIEWRAISLETAPNRSLRDRSGRFEDAFVNWEMTERAVFRVGQFRALNQVDVSRRLSVSEPAVFSSSLPGDPASRARITSLRAFSPAGRSPGFSFGYQSLTGDAPADGLFHHATLPFVGELSLPLSDEAYSNASFELQGPPKGVFLETYYRKGLSSLGVHTFLDDDRWLATAVATHRYKDLHFALAAGVDDTDRRRSRGRYSAEVEYLSTRWERVRPGVGFRVEEIGRTAFQPAYVPYFVIAGPNEKYTLLLQLEGRFQRASQAVFLDLSLLF
jgi:hypothetical protein